MKDRFNNAVGPQVRSARRGARKAIPALAALTLVGGFQAATQFFAHAFHYQSALRAFHACSPAAGRRRRKVAPCTPLVMWPIGMSDSSNPFQTSRHIRRETCP